MHMMTLLLLLFSLLFIANDSKNIAIFVARISSAFLSSNGSLRSPRGTSVTTPESLDLLKKSKQSTKI
jgi:hypothetical protein